MTGGACAFLLWDGQLFGGAETMTIGLVAAMRKLGYPAHIVFVGNIGVYAPLLDRYGLEGFSAGIVPGSGVLARPGSLVSAIDRTGAECVLLPSSGYLAAALRVGGYRGCVVGVEHGGLLQVGRLGALRRGVERVDRMIGARAMDAQVAVSDVMLEALRRVPHAEKIVRIHNGVDLEAFGTAETARRRRRDTDPTVVIGCAGKLMDGKGVEDLIAALARLEGVSGWRCEIAGDGPVRHRLEELAGGLGVAASVRFVGWTDDMPGFWAGCDIAVAPSNGCIESFGMTAAEAMASGIPVIVSRSGALPEVLGGGGAGAVYEPGDECALAEALSEFIADSITRASASHAAVARARELSIEGAAVAYIALLAQLAGGQR